MLPYHVIYPERRQQNDSQFLHYLNLGSHFTSFQLHNIFSLSKITLNPKKHLPKLNYDDLKAKCQSEGSKLHYLAIPLYGNFTIDQKVVSNLFEQESNEKGQENTKTNFDVKECKFVQDFEYISNKQEKDKDAVFLFILYKSSESQSQSQSGSSNSHINRLSAFLQQKSLIHIAFGLNSSSVEISFIQFLEDTKITLNQNDLVYLEKGKINLIIEGEGSKTQIKNKGNRKGEQNYIDNMIQVSEQLKVQVEKGSLIFLISQKVKEQ